MSTIYLGGGTPSALGADRITNILHALFEHFGVPPGSIECTLEANPARHGRRGDEQPPSSQSLDRNTTLNGNSSDRNATSDLIGFRAAGVTRLSIGVQSFDDGELQRLGRDHNAAQATEYVSAARAAGFANVSLDLIAGVPGQTLASFERSLEIAVACRPDHVSVYGLTIEAGTPYARWHERTPQQFPDDDSVADLLELSERTLTSAGFEHYEISNYARPGFESVHNRSYWQQRDCIALGMSASGYQDGLRYRNFRSFDAYCGALEAGRDPREEEERLDFAGRVGEAAILALRTREGIQEADFHRRFGVGIWTAFAGAIKKCREAGLLEDTGQGVRLSSRGRLLANAACAEFLHPSFLPAPAGLGQITS